LLTKLLLERPDGAGELGWFQELQACTRPILF
jgi:hypothetical protein